MNPPSIDNANHSGHDISEPEADCPLCPRLVAFRNENRGANPDWFNGAVPSFGPQTAQLLIVGLAPGVQGANKTGRPFTGDYAGDLLYETLRTYKFAKGVYDARADDGLELAGCMITNAVRCVPPQNKPVGEEINNCRPFLANRIASLHQLKVILALGKIAHDSVIKTFGMKLSANKFAHQATHQLDVEQLRGRSENGYLTLIDSYHCSRYNTNTGRLTTEMFHGVFETIAKLLKGA